MQPKCPQCDRDQSLALTLAPIPANAPRLCSHPFHRGKYPV